MRRWWISLLASLVFACGGKAAQEPAAPPAPPAQVAEEQPATEPATAEADATQARTATTSGQASSSAGGPTLTEAEVAALGERMLTLVGEVTTAVEDHATDCDAMAAAVDHTLAARATDIADMKRKAGGAANDELFEAWMAQNQGRAQALAARLSPGMQKCSGHPGVQHAFEKLDI